MNTEYTKPEQNDGESASLPLSSFNFKPVGVVQSEIKKPVLKADKQGLSLEEHREKAKAEHNKIKTLISEIVIRPELKDILDGIEGYSHLLILYWPHLVPILSRNLLKVHPMGCKDIPKQGIFATCSPARPNPVLVTAVKLVERNENILKVQGLEAVDKSPVIDIKPYNPGYYRIENPAIPEWLQSLQND